MREQFYKSGFCFQILEFINSFCPTKPFFSRNTLGFFSLRKRIAFSAKMNQPKLFQILGEFREKIGTFGNLQLTEI